MPGRSCSPGPGPGSPGFDAVERIRLLEAVRAYLRAGSTVESVESLYCYRNMLMNGLPRFAELIGVDVAVPEQAAGEVDLYSGHHGIMP